MENNYTKTLRIKLFIIRLVAFAVFVVPLVIFSIIAFKEAMKNLEKLILIGCIGLASIIEVFSLFFKTHKRSPIWIVLIGLTVIIHETILPLMIVLGIGACLDDFVFVPLIDYYRTSLVASKTYDKRQKYDKVKEEKEVEPANENL